MNREIKFRAWDGKKMIDNYCFLNKNKGNHFFAEDENEFGNIIAVMQYTGLKDKNGKEIYEGDIYRSEFSIDDEKGIDEIIYFVCIFFKPLAAFCWISIDEYNLNQDGECLEGTEEYPFTLNKDEMKNILIIDNAYENKKSLVL